MSYILEPSPISKKKWRATSPTGKKVDFGAVGYEDYTIHLDPDRKDRYVARHQARENWNKSGIDTAGFWSRWLLWNKPDFMESVKDIEKRFNIKIDTSSVKKNSDGSKIIKTGVKNSGNNESRVNKPLVSDSWNNMSDQELYMKCNNISCKDDIFWYNRVLTSFKNKAGYNSLMINKPQDLTWQQYFMQLYQG